jgi:cytidyltransferase-like protein
MIASMQMTVCAELSQHKYPEKTMEVKDGKKVFVSGCFDILHSGHIAFLQEASQFGDLYVGLGSDRTIAELKGRMTVNSEDERLYMLKALSCVHEVKINKGTGILDFLEDMRELKPDVFVVNEDGHTPEKEKLCMDLGVEYKVLRRIPYANLPVRSTTSLRTETPIPYRIDLAGTWIDQPYVSKYYPGWAITASIEPTIEFNERSGMATSTRKKAIELWNAQLPMENPEKLAKILFRYDNDPGIKDVSGSQDSIGIAVPGINRFYYDREQYWPSRIETISDLSVIKWLEQRIYMVTLWPRPADFIVLENTNISTENVRNLTRGAELAWEGLLNKDIDLFVRGFTTSFNSQVTMFPKMMNEKIDSVIDRYRNTALSWKLSGAGGGGYLILISEKEIPNAIRIKIRVKDYWI